MVEWIAAASAVGQAFAKNSAPMPTAANAANWIDASFDGSNWTVATSGSKASSAAPGSGLPLSPLTIGLIVAGIVLWRKFS